MSGIPLSKEHGLNVAMTTCYVCGGPGDELVLAGNSIKWRCDKCGANHLAYAGQAGRMVCDCGNKYRNGRRFTKLAHFDGGRDKTLSSQPCKSCRDKQAAVDKEVAAGGVHFRCKDCGSEGAITAGHQLAKDVRAKHIASKNIKAPENGGPHEPCGVEFSAEWLCPVCGPQTRPMVIGDDKGAASVEYGLLIALICIAALGGATVLGVNVIGVFSDMANNLPLP